MQERLVVLCTLLSLLAASPLLAQVEQPGWQTPRTPEGYPDLQGIWTNATQMPLQRPLELEQRRAYSEEEAVAREQRAAQVEALNNSPSDPDRLPPSDGDVAAAYNSFWLDRGNATTRIRGEYRTSLIIDPPDGRIPWLPETERTPTQLTRWLQQDGVGPFDGPELQTIGERCLLFYDYRTSNSSAGPPMMPTYYNNNYQIVQTEDYVMILAEMMHDARIIRLDAKHGPDVHRKWMGDSVGHWEGDSLVVITRLLHPQQSHYGSSNDLVVTERFTRESQEQIVYQFTMDDPSVYRQTWTAEMAFRARPADERIYEYACHEGNYALGGILSGARVQERDLQN